MSSYPACYAFLPNFQMGRFVLKFSILPQLPGTDSEDNIIIFYQPDTDMVVAECVLDDLYYLPDYLVLV